MGSPGIIPDGAGRVRWLGIAVGLYPEDGAAI